MHEQVVDQILGTKNIDINAVDFQGRSALRLAVSNDAPLRIIQQLVDAKANVNLVGKDKFNILERYFTYADNIDPEIVDLILKAGFDTKLLKLDDQILLEKIKDSKNHAVNTERQEMTKSLTRKGQNTSSLAPIKKQTIRSGSQLNNFEHKRFSLPERKKTLSKLST